MERRSLLTIITCWTSLGILAATVGAGEAPRQPSPKEAPTNAVRGKVQVGVYTDVGAGRSLKNLMRVLGEFDDVSVRRFTADDIRSGKLKEVDVLIQPGGSGGKQGRHLAKAGRASIREFVNGGGGYIGFCAGAYRASADYEWSLDILDAKVLDRKHWARGTGRVDIEFTEPGRRLMKWEAKRVNDARCMVHSGRKGPGVCR